MKWILITAGALVGLIALAAIVGATLPRDHVATLSARIAAAPDAVWRAITTPAEFPTWRSSVRRVELLPDVDGRPSWREHSKDGALTMVVDAWDPPSRLTSRIVDTGLPFGGAWDFALTPDGVGGTHVTITEHGSVYNPIFRFVSRFIMGHTATLDAYLRALGRKFGDEPTPTTDAD